MIKLCTDTVDFDSIKELSFNDPFGCRITALYLTYGAEPNFVDYWIQTDSIDVTSAIARIDNAFIVRTTSGSDVCELSDFLRMISASAVITNTVLDLPLNYREGPVLCSDSVMDNNLSFDVVVPELKDYYFLIKSSSSDNFTVPSYEDFMLDVRHRLNSGTSRIYGIKDNNRLISAIMTLAETSDTAVLGALSTADEYRRQGIGSFLIKYINNVLCKEGKKVFLHRAPDENISFYSQLGFKYFCNWLEYFEE